MTTTALAITTNLPTGDKFEIDAADVKKYIAPTATDKELFWFLNICRSYGLNPFKREIHWVKYGNNPGEAIVGYEAYLKRAERTNKLDGWNVTLAKDNLGEKAVVTIYRKDHSKPFVWEAYRSEFDKKQSTWKAMPYFMLKKVAIAQAFRIAFPEEMGGMPYTFEENETIRNSQPLAQVAGDIVDVEEMITRNQQKLMFALMTEKGLNADDMKALIMSRYGKNSSNDLTKDEGSDIIDHLQTLEDAPTTPPQAGDSTPDESPASPPPPDFELGQEEDGYSDREQWVADRFFKARLSQLHIKGVPAITIAIREAYGTVESNVQPEVDKLMKLSDVDFVDALKGIGVDCGPEWRV